ncbi:MAG: dephospho-CoA kinase [Candidatus Aminicenantes bacterium]|nr:dephospho-CoA kinase [Candidatus Aminicenantes bacterium]
MLLVALTGGIASGKSVVSFIFKELGFYVDHADRTAQTLMKPGSDSWNKIVKHFGKNILTSDGNIDRIRLGQIIFSNSEERQYLNGIIHPLVHEEKKRTIARLQKEGTFDIYVSESALIIESGTISFYDRVVVVACPQRIQIKRLMERDGISRNEALQKIRSQLSTGEKKKYADYVINSSGSIQSTIEQAEKVTRYLKRDYTLKKAGKILRSSLLPYSKEQ